MANPPTDSPAVLPLGDCLPVGKPHVVEVDTESLPRLSDASTATGSPVTPQSLDHELPDVVAPAYEGFHLLRLAAAVVLGGLFGTAFEKSLVYAPAAIRGQFVFETWIMMKMFMGALGASAASFVLFNQVCPEKLTVIRGVHAYTQNRLRVAGGAFLLGIGMAIAGACPGLVIAQVGVRVPQADFTLCAGIAGAFLAGMLRLPYLPPEEQVQRHVEDVLEAKARELLGLKREQLFTLLGLAIAGCCWGFALVLELVIPYTDEAAEKLGPQAAEHCWPPSLCGAIIGALQVPCTLLIGDSLGTSAAYSAVAGFWRMLKSKKCGVFPQFDAALRKWWQLVYLLSACAAAYGAASEDGSLGLVEGAPALHAAVGGFLMVFGSRVAEGCTSGHGISGVSLLKLDSILATAAMFGGAILSGIVMKVAGVLLDLEK